MGFTIQNSETGEMIYIRSDNILMQQQKYDAETGEPDTGRVLAHCMKEDHFHIPKALLEKKSSQCPIFGGIRPRILTDTNNHTDNPYQCKDNEMNSQSYRLDTKLNTSYKKYGFINMEGVSKDIILGYNKNNYRLLLLPTIFCFNVYAALSVTIIEVFLHLWSHQKNGLNANARIYYRSPLHIITSQFCIRCRNESDSNIFHALNAQMRRKAYKRKATALKQTITKAIVY